MSNSWACVDDGCTTLSSANPDSGTYWRAVIGFGLCILAGSASLAVPIFVYRAQKLQALALRQPASLVFLGIALVTAVVIPYSEWQGALAVPCDLTRTSLYLTTALMFPSIVFRALGVYKLRRRQLRALIALTLQHDERGGAGGLETMSVKQSRGNPNGCCNCRRIAGVAPDTSVINTNSKTQSPRRLASYTPRISKLSATRIDARVDSMDLHQPWTQIRLQLPVSAAYMIPLAVRIGMRAAQGQDEALACEMDAIDLTLLSALAVPSCAILLWIHLQLRGFHDALWMHVQTIASTIVLLPFTLMFIIGEASPSWASNGAPAQYGLFWIALLDVVISVWLPLAASYIVPAFGAHTSARHRLQFTDESSKASSDSHFKRASGSQAEGSTAASFEQSPHGSYVARDDGPSLLDADGIAERGPRTHAYPEGHRHRDDVATGGSTLSEFQLTARNSRHSFGASQQHSRARGADGSASQGDGSTMIGSDMLVGWHSAPDAVVKRVGDARLLLQRNPATMSGDDYIRLTLLLVFTISGRRALRRALISEFALENLLFLLDAARYAESARAARRCAVQIQAALNPAAVPATARSTSDQGTQKQPPTTVHASSVSRRRQSALVDTPATTSNQLEQEDRAFQSPVTEASELQPSSEVKTVEPGSISHASAEASDHATSRARDVAAAYGLPLCSHASSSESQMHAVTSSGVEDSTSVQQAANDDANRMQTPRLDVSVDVDQAEKSNGNVTSRVTPAHNTARKRSVIHVLSSHTHTGVASFQLGATGPAESRVQLSSMLVGTEISKLLDLSGRQLSRIVHLYLSPAAELQVNVSALAAKRAIAAAAEYELFVKTCYGDSDDADSGAFGNDQHDALCVLPASNLQKKRARSNRSMTAVAISDTTAATGIDGIDDDSTVNENDNNTIADDSGGSRIGWVGTAWARMFTTSIARGPPDLSLQIGRLAASRDSNSQQPFTSTAKQIYTGKATTGQIPTNGKGTVTLTKVNDDQSMPNTTQRDATSNDYATARPRRDSVCSTGSGNTGSGGRAFGGSHRSVSTGPPSSLLFDSVGAITATDVLQHRGGAATTSVSLEGKLSRRRLPVPSDAPATSRVDVPNASMIDIQQLTRGDVMSSTPNAQAELNDAASTGTAAMRATHSAGAAMLSPLTMAVKSASVLPRIATPHTPRKTVSRPLVASASLAASGDIQQRVQTSMPLYAEDANTLDASVLQPHPRPATVVQAAALHAATEASAIAPTSWSAGPRRTLSSHVASVSNVPIKPIAKMPTFSSMRVLARDAPSVAAAAHAVAKSGADAGVRQERRWSRQYVPDATVLDAAVEQVLRLLATGAVRRFSGSDAFAKCRVEILEEIVPDVE